MLALLATLTLGPMDSGGCAHAVLLNGKPLSGGPAPFCIREVVTLVLDELPMVALRVEAPHRFDARLRSRVFLYRVNSGHLVPRFLGSGVASREVTRLIALEGALGLDTTSGRLRCVFDGFPLVCSESSGARKRGGDPSSSLPDIWEPLLWRFPQG